MLSFFLFPKIQGTSNWIFLEICRTLFSLVFLFGWPWSLLSPSTFLFMYPFSSSSFKAFIDFSCLTFIDFHWSYCICWILLLLPSTFLLEFLFSSSWLSIVLNVVSNCSKTVCWFNICRHFITIVDQFFILWRIAQMAK